MDAWIIWLIAAAALTVGEVLTVSFFLFPFAAGAAAAAVAALAGGSSPVAWVVFAVVSVVSLALVRPVARRHLTAPPAIRTGTAALVGERAVVLDLVDEDRGTVRLAGEVWSARPFDEDHVYEPGTRVQVIDIRGATAIVAD
jgi:membrane protein implicated in regulation of membrane protease activity